MARGRMLDQRFATSAKLRSLSRDDRLIYATILPFVDREGRHCAEPYVLMATIFRLTDFTIDEVVNGIARLNAVGLIELYSDDDNTAVLQIDRFLEFNKPNHKEAASQFSKPEHGTAVRDELLTLALVTAFGDAPGHPPGEPPGRPPGNAPPRRNAERPSFQHEEPETPSTTAAPHTPGTPPGNAGGHPQGTPRITERNGSSVPEQSAPRTERRTRPEGRARPAAIDNYLNRRKPKNETTEADEVPA